MTYRYANLTEQELFALTKGGLFKVRDMAAAQELGWRYSLGQATIDIGPLFWRVRLCN
jgi:hypothetical protein